MRSCAFCGRELGPTARSTARYCTVQHRRAAYRMRVELRIVDALLSGRPAGRFATAEQYAATRRSIARSARIGDGRGGARTPHTDATTRRGEPIHA